VYILGIGAAHPEHVITNEFLEELGIGSLGDWIVDKIGIRERRSVLPLDYIKKTHNEHPMEALKVASETPADLGIRAAKKALELAGIKATDLGMVITNCCSPRDMIPQESQKIAKALGIKRAKVYDVFTACPAFALLIHHVNQIDSDKLPDYILCISTATLTTKVNYKDRSDSAIWGDGAAAWVISPRKQGRLEIVASDFDADPPRCQAVVVETFGHFHQDGRAVRDFSVRQTVRMVKKLEEKFSLDWQRDIFVGHQANGTMLAQICNNRNVPASNHWSNVEFIGNQAGAGAPAVISEHWNDLGPSGRHILVAVVGAGLSWGSTLLRVV
jgi:3-oxoacyl-[acyl-carrier-protein] synthase III